MDPKSKKKLNVASSYNEVFPDRKSNPLPDDIVPQHIWTFLKTFIQDKDQRLADPITLEELKGHPEVIENLYETIKTAVQRGRFKPQSIADKSLSIHYSDYPHAGEWNKNKFETGFTSKYTLPLILGQTTGLINKDKKEITISDVYDFSNSTRDRMLDKYDKAREESGEFGALGVLLEKVVSDIDNFTKKNDIGNDIGQVLDYGVNLGGIGLKSLVSEMANLRIGRDGKPIKITLPMNNDLMNLVFGTPKSKIPEKSKKKIDKVISRPMEIKRIVPLEYE